MNVHSSLLSHIGGKNPNGYLLIIFENLTPKLVTESDFPVEKLFQILSPSCRELLENTAQLLNTSMNEIHTCKAGGGGIEGYRKFTL